MSVWVGTLGGMVETPCLSGLDVVPQDRAVRGGGPGTLTDPFVVKWGPSTRVWSCTINAKTPGALASLETLSTMQEFFGGALRMLACDAHNTNVLPPLASKVFAGWSGAFTVAPAPFTASEVVGGGTVLYPATPLDARTPLEGGPPVRQVDSVAAITVTALASATLVSPIVPARPGHPVTLGIFAQGNVTISARWVDAAGDPISTVAQPSVSHSALQRLTPTTQPAPANAAGVRLVVTGGTRYAWPSVTWTAGPRPYANGRGAESVELTPISEGVLHATARQQLSGFRYTVTEMRAA